MAKPVLQENRWRHIYICSVMWALAYRMGMQGEGTEGRGGSARKHLAWE